MADYIKKIRISSGEELQIDYDSLANLPTAKYSKEDKDKLNRTVSLVAEAGTNIADNSDINSVEFLSIGSYYCSSYDRAKTLINCPTKDAFIMHVYCPNSYTNIDKETSSTWVYRTRKILTVDGDEYTQYTHSEGTAGTFIYGAWNKIVKDNDSVITGMQDSIDEKQDKISLTASRAVVSNSSGQIAVSAVTSAELGYLDGVTSNIQTQLNAKQPTVTGAATTIASSDLTASRALVSNSSGKVAVSAVTSTELGYLDGVTSAVQTQLNSKADLTQLNSKADLSSGKIVATQATSPVSSFAANKPITSSDNGKFFYSNSTSELTVTIPDDSNIPTGTEIEFCRFGSGALKITCASTLYFYGIGATAGVGKKTYSITDRYGCAALKKIGNTTWIISGAVELV